MYSPHHWDGNMETYSNGPQILQGQTVYQVIGKPSVMPQMQQAVQSNTSHPNIVQSGYQYTPTSNMVASSGLNRSAEMPNTKAVNQANYVVQDVDNSNKVVLWIHNPGYRSNSLNVNHVPGNKPRDQVQNIQSTGQGISNASSANLATITTQKTFKNSNIANHPAKVPMKIPEPTHVNLNAHVNEKVGSLKIHISESFLPWNITNKTVLDLEFMRHLFNISGIDVILTDAKQNEKAIRAAVEQLLYSRVLPDWLVLKCEEKEIPFLKVNNQVEIYTVSNFTALLNVVTQETCLPLPFIAEEKNYAKYLYLNFPKTGNDKVKKLNTPIFHVADNGKKRLLCKYPGIRLDCDFENRVENFIIHVHQSALLAYETSVSKIRQFIIYRHVIWGFLQMWIRRVMEKYNQCFKFDDIAKNLSLCKSEDGKSCGNDNELIYDIGYLNCYLKFDPVTLKETKATFSLDNFSTNTVCNLAIVQFYKQFFLINDMHYSDALKNTVLFFQDLYGKNVVKASSYVGIPPSLKSLRLIPRNNESPPEQVVPLMNNAYKNAVNGNLSAKTSSSAAPQSITVGSINNNVIQIEPDKTSAIPVSEKPRLKTRTVEEINSSVDLGSRTDRNSTVVSPDCLKALTVEEINSAVGFVKRTDMNDDSLASPVGQTTDARRRENTRRLNYGSFISLIQKFMENCYASNKVEISSRDESKEEVVIKRRFDEAVRRAIGMETIELFIEKIYVHLQMYYTNSTSQYILNNMIWRAIEAKYPHLKEHVSKHIAKSLRDKLSDGDPRDSNMSSSVLASDGRLDETVTGNNQNGNQNSITTLAVAQQPNITNSGSEVDVCSTGEKDQAISAISKAQAVSTISRAQAVSTISRAQAVSTISKVQAVSTISRAQAVSTISRSQAVSTISKVQAVSTISKAQAVSTISRAQAVSTISKAQDVSTISKAQTVSTIAKAQAVSTISKAQDVSTIAKAQAVSTISKAQDVNTIAKAQAVSTISKAQDVSTIAKAQAVSTISKIQAVSTISKAQDVSTISRAQAVSTISKAQAVSTISKAQAVSTISKAQAVSGISKDLAEGTISKAQAVSTISKDLAEGTISKAQDVNTISRAQAVSTISKAQDVNTISKAQAVSTISKDQAVSSISKDQDVDLGNASSPCVSAENITEQEPPVSTATEEPKDKNAPISESLQECLPSSGCEKLLKKTKKHSKQRRLKESRKKRLPYRNTLTFVRVSTSPATFRISSRSEINSKAQSIELGENESCSAPEENSIQATNEILETDRASEEQEQPPLTIEETEEVYEECPRQEDYSKYNLKPCSVVLNSNEVNTYMKKYGEKERREISSEESDEEQDQDYVPGRGRRRFYGGDSDDADFITERKRIRRAVSEIQYMEARTRVLQRLRKRKSLYVGYERTRISGEELDSFLVRQSSLSRLNHLENSEDESEGEYENGKGKDSEAKESQRRKTCKNKGPAMKEVRVVLVRLEDTPEYEEHRERLLRKEKWNPSVNYLNGKKFPHVKRKYFEIREGKLYLKEGYCVKDGEIVRTEKEVSPMRPKREPESPARETDFDHHLIKRESSLD